MIMAEIRTFCAVHPAEGLASKLAALPYDVYSRDEAREQVKKAPESFLAIDRPETQFQKIRICMHRKSIRKHMIC